MRILGRKEKETPAISPEVERDDPGELRNFFGREFRTVKNGLDPDQVVNFLESVLGSTEAALKRMEHLAALQKSTQDMEMMITEARLLSERIKAQSEQDGRVEKDRIIAEANKKAAELIEKGEHQSLETIEQTRKACTASIEGTKTVVAEVQRKMGQLLEQTEKRCGETLISTSSLIQEAIVKTREMADADLAALKKDIDGSVEETRKELAGLGDQFAGLLPEEPMTPAANHPVERTEAALAAVQPPVVVASHAGIPPVLQTGKADASVNLEPEPNPRKKNNNSLLSGEAILFIPKEADQAWIQQLRQRLLGVPSLSIRMELGNLTGGKTMIIYASEMVALPSLLLDMPGVEEVQEDDGQEPHEPLKRSGNHATLSRTRTLTVLLNNRNN